MTYYNIDKLEALKEEYLKDKSEAYKLHGSIHLDAFIDFIHEKEKASSFDPNQLEIPFGDEDNSK